MNFEPTIEWFPDAGGITEISRWRKPPVRNTERGEPPQGRRNDVGRFPFGFAQGLEPVERPQPLPGLTFVIWQGTGGLRHRLISDVPPGQTPPSALKVHDTL
jgi:hypothetical protein